MDFALRFVPLAFDVGTLISIVAETAGQRILLLFHHSFLEGVQDVRTVKLASFVEKRSSTSIREYDHGLYASLVASYLQASLLS